MRADRILIARIKLALLVTLVLIGLLMAGSLSPLGYEEGKAIEEELKKLGEDSLELEIFLNNFSVALLSAIPFLGPFIMGYVIFHTGRFLGWVLAQSGMPPSFGIPLTLLLIFLTGYGILEFMGYGILVAESITISYYILRARRLLRRELKILLLIVLISAALLALGAIIEAAFIRSQEELLEGLGI
ncbi:MAG: stage II sporulation protein M [Thaumarchaeota archaeon]|nr:stage II sporulation protein M [Nitrososphaerota archaeon]